MEYIFFLSELRKKKIDYNMNKFNSPFYLDDKLEKSHLDFFKANGFIVFRNFLSPQHIESILHEISRIEEQLLKDGIQKINGVPLKFGKNADGELSIQRICFSSLYSDILKKVVGDNRLLLLKDFLSPFDARINEHEKDGLVLNNYIRTQGSSFSKMGWHTDCPRDIFLGQRIMPMLNIGIHLDDCLAENGGLRVLPGTHKQGVFKMLFGKKYFIDNDDDRREVGFDINKGDLSVHCGRLWHRVKESPLYGIESRRRVMYIPMITGKQSPKNEFSKTPFYHRISSKIKI